MKKQFNRGTYLKFASMTAALLGVCLSSNLQAQETDDNVYEMEAFVVESMLGSLIEAQEIKQETTPFVDAIVAQDIGKLPDNTVADALQRVPGIQVSRGSGEVGTVLIRGLPDFATTLNGEEIFTGVNRGVNLGDLPADLISSVSAYKSRTADQVEGGIAGLIDVRLRQPFDFDGAKTGVSLRLINGEDAGETSWVGSMMTSNRWELEDGGQFGILFGASSQNIKYQDQTIYNYLWENRDFTNDAGSPLVYPFNSGPIVHRGDRTRTAYNLSMQWAPSENTEIYANYMYTGYENKYQNYFFVGLPFTGVLDSYELYPGTTDVVSRATTSNHFLITSTQAYNDKTDGHNMVVGVRHVQGNMIWKSELLYNYNKFVNQNLIMDLAKGGIPQSIMTFHKDNHFDATYPGTDITAPDGFGIWGLFDNNGYAEGKSIVWRGDLEYNTSSNLFPVIETGLRFSRREVSSRQSDRADVPPADGRGVTMASAIAGLGANAPDNSSGLGTTALENWYTPSADFLYNEADQVRALFGLPAGLAPHNPAVAFDDEETTLAGYAQSTYTTSVADMPLDGQIGLRVVKTDLSLRGYETSSPIESDSDDIDFLPVLNGRLRMDENSLLRFSYSRSITRPNFGDLNPVVNLSGPTTTGGAAGTGSGGNPELSPVKSDNWDIAYEWYYTESNYLSVAGFHRKIDGYVFTATESESIGGETYNVTRPRNTGEGELSGVELSIQHFFKSVKGLGIQANFTYITGETYDPSVGEALDLANVSENSYNIILIYEAGKFSSRLAYNWRDAFIEDFNQANAPGGPGGTLWVDATSRMDFSASYSLTDWATLTFDITNLTKQGRQDYFDSIDSAYPRDANMYDRTYELGARFKF